MLFDSDIALELTHDEWEIVTRPVNGNGGTQGLLRGILQTETAPRKLLVTYRQLDRAYHYAWEYGQGGFQDRFRAVCAAATRAGWTPGPFDPPDRKPGGAFGRRK